GDALDVLLLAHIRRQGNRASSARFAFPRQLLKELASARRQRQPGALARKQPCRALAKSARGARNDDDFVLQTVRCHGTSVELGPARGLASRGASPAPGSGPD